MRALIDAARAARLMEALGAAAPSETRIYFTGGITAVLLAWRAGTVDADLLIVPESDRILRAVPEIKESLHLNIELAAPLHFIPELPGWEGRSPFIARHGRASFHHFDLLSQALAKIERGHARDLEDVAAMMERGLVERGRLREMFAAIEGDLYRYPAVDPARFRLAVQAITD